MGYRNIFDTKTIDRIVWFIPIKKLRDNVRDLLTAFFLTYKRVNIIMNKLNYINNDKPKDYVSILATIKNEAPYIKEWIEYHRMIGVDRFYIYDNDSTDNIKEVLKDYIKSGIVIYNFFGGIGKQLDIYEDGIDRYGANTFWMAIIDLDEFIVPAKSYDIITFLKDNENFEYSTGRDMPNSINKIRINHYATKSLEEYKQKINKKDNDGITKNDMSIYKAEPSYIDNIMDKYIDDLKKRLL